MRRITISIDDHLADTFDRLVKDKGYENRSEAFRDLLRDELDQQQLVERNSKHCVGTLSYVYNHHERQLATRLVHMQHEHHDVTVATMHAHLDHDNCIETVILSGPTAQVLSFAQAVITERGVRHGKFHPVPVRAEIAAKRHEHVHLHPFA
ncbi:MAG: nickel-responsive transcriptional regulator NikR [Steroidobacteraceae bacterium]